tara:strand:- start:2982 stop:3308 length:327 start_codon:yes stop_codon:yes gene_type:complete
MEKESIFEDYFGNSPQIRILNFLILGKDFDYSMTDIAEGANVGWTSFTRVWRDLQKKKIVIPTRNIGRAKLYKLNVEDPTVKKLIKLHWEIIKSETDKIFSKKEKILS